MHPLGFLSSHGFPGTWADWSQYINMAYPSTPVTGTHGEILLGFDLSQLDAEFWNSVDSTGKDIGIARNADPNTPLDYYLDDTWDYMANTGMLWIFSGGVTDTSDTPFRLYTGNPSATPPDPQDFYDKCAAEGYKAIWDFEQTPVGGSNTLTDHTGNGHDMQATTHFSPGQPTSIAGKIGNAWSIPNNSAHQRIQRPSTTDLDIGTNHAAWGAWVRISGQQPDSAGNRLATIHGRDLLSGGMQGGGVYLVNEIPGAQLRSDSPTNVSAGVTGVTDINDSVWHYVVAVAERGSVTGMRIYVDGSLEASNDLTPLDGRDLTGSTPYKAVAATNNSGANTFRLIGDIDFSWHRIGAFPDSDQVATEFTNQDSHQWQQGATVTA